MNINAATSPKDETSSALAQDTSLKMTTAVGAETSERRLNTGPRHYGTEIFNTSDSNYESLRAFSNLFVVSKSTRDIYISKKEKLV